MDETTVDKAIDSPLTDFEDALQYYAAESQEVDFIVTREETLTFAENGIELVDQLIPVNEIWKEALREAITKDL